MKLPSETATIDDVFRIAKQVVNEQTISTTWEAVGIWALGVLSCIVVAVIVAILINTHKKDPTSSDKAREIADQFEREDDEDGVRLAMAIVKHIVKKEEQEYLDAIPPTEVEPPNQIQLS